MCCETERECCYRKVGGLYLVCELEGVAARAIPGPLRLRSWKPIGPLSAVI